MITRDGERAMRAELRRLRRELDVDFAERFREARSFGQAAANDEYLQAQEEANVLIARIGRLEALLEWARVVEEGAGSGTVAAIGTRIQVEDADTGAATEYRLVGGHEPLAANEVTADSPVGAALMGQGPGATVEIALPSGRSRRLTVLAIDTA